MSYVYLAIAACVCAFFIILLRSRKGFRRFCLSAIGGFAGLGAINLTGLATGVVLGINAWTIGAAVILGLPGVVSMLVIKLIWGI